MMMMMMQQYYHVVGDNRAFDAITTELEDAFLWSEQLPLWNLQFLRLLFQGLQPWSRQSFAITRASFDPHDVDHPHST